jgi:thiamine biosynthesis protein ThiS
MEVVVNGEPKQLDAGTSLAAMIEEMGLDRRYLVVEYNGQPLPRDGFERVELADGDRLELVRPVAGG